MEQVAEAATLREGDITMRAYGGHRTVTIIVVSVKHLAEVIFALAHTQQFRLNKGGASIIPAGTRLRLILHRCNRQFLDDGKLVALILFLVRGGLCHCRKARQHCGKNNSNSLHCISFNLFCLYYYNAISPHLLCFDSFFSSYRISMQVFF